MQSGSRKQRGASCIISDRLLSVILFPRVSQGTDALTESFHACPVRSSLNLINQTLAVSFSPRKKKKTFAVSLETEKKKQYNVLAH
jgi:hypothetical protein